MAKADTQKIKTGFLTGIGIAIAGMVVGFVWAKVRPMLGNIVPA